MITALIATGTGLVALAVGYAWGRVTTVSRHVDRRLDHEMSRPNLPIVRTPKDQP